ncbi:hypothetical protein PEC18_09950 [Paucibacter sp. O1-1]|nr:hypothetical protein [Paucibacter sp. O1-1]MDA3826170.1 hypothetical protein [Paucibacter sp. O1-1]
MIYDAVLSKNMSSNLNINKAETPDIIITDATNVGKSIVKKAVSDGKSLLLMNLTEPASEINRINVALGTRFQVKKTSNEASVSLGNPAECIAFCIYTESLQSANSENTGCGRKNYRESGRKLAE